MAFDKFVDSAQLDGAITASADAIRAKTGGTESLTWDMSTGLADAISSIPTGSIEPYSRHIAFLTTVTQWNPTYGFFSRNESAPFKDRCHIDYMSRISTLTVEVESDDIQYCLITAPGWTLTTSEGVKTLTKNVASMSEGRSALDSIIFDGDNQHNYDAVITVIATDDQGSTIEAQDVIYLVYSLAPNWNVVEDNNLIFSQWENYTWEQFETAGKVLN